MSTTEEIGNGVNVEYDDKTLTITIDLTKEYGLSGSKKSTMIATAKGNKELENGISIGLNVYRPV